MTGTKEGCNDGNCGACTVISDVRIVDPYLVLAVETPGKEITTIEGLATPEGLHPLQRDVLEQLPTEAFLNARTLSGHGMNGR